MRQLFGLFGLPGMLELLPAISRHGTDCFRRIRKLRAVKPQRVRKKDMKKEPA